ncbi:hypothetical protein [Clostridium sp. C105KSO13]|uniref:hypothetical protein n=1 Tax=Clostridium sp. C105KSO13 TaxID=1776045 RepID=UPI0007406ABC|nr:hypothetical protein [Clostridium sp. C105KSO13]CUX40504.1 hypothetical protein BN3456_02078 [Clostridium sp. C105KSO13]
MSKILGPVHTKMYERILHQEKMIKAIINLAVQNGWSADLQNKINQEAPEALNEPLENIIDQSNIHGWLGQAVEASEKRFARAVYETLREDAQRVDELKKAMKKLGWEYILPEGLNAKETYQAICDILLDGMPCDFPFDVTEQSADVVKWRIRNCPHEKYWKYPDFGVDVYYSLRDSWIEGVLENYGIVYSHTATSEYCLRKEGK